MTLKIERIFSDGRTRILLSGQLRSDQLDPLKTEIGRGTLPVDLDLGEVDLLDLDSVHFLNECERVGIAVIGCSPYIREWMLRERGTPKAQPGP